MGGGRLTSHQFWRLDNDANGKSDPKYLLPNEPQKKPPTFHYTGCSIGILILIMVYYNPYITG